jgi:predicted transglutaminase-like cysteine proteinase
MRLTRTCALAAFKPRDRACAGATSAAPVGADVLRRASVVNKAANQRIRPITDMDQYATAERWSLPTKRGGDCED